MTLFLTSFTLSCIHIPCRILQRSLRCLFLKSPASSSNVKEISESQKCLYGKKWNRVGRDVQIVWWKIWSETNMCNIWEHGPGVKIGFKPWFFSDLWQNTRKAPSKKTNRKICWSIKLILLKLQQVRIPT